MPIDDAFRLKVEGSVVVVGVIAAGEIKPGTRLEIRTADVAIPVTVTAIEGGSGNSMSHARAGDRVSVLLQGASKDQIPPGSRLTGGGG
jgi:translation elongation factor EF-Tu-like GTPase